MDTKNHFNASRYECKMCIRDRTATVQILEFERPETKFHSVEELKDRVMKDMRYGEEYLKNHPFDER